MKRILLGLLLSAGLGAPAAHAANYVLNLSGNAPDLVTNTFTFNGVTYDTGALELTGFTPFTLHDGDTVEVTVDITSGPFVVPLRDTMFFGLNFADISGGAQPTTASDGGTFSFDGGGALPVGCSNCTSFIYGRSGPPVISFTSLAAHGSFTLSEDYQINSITVSYQVNNEAAAAPEPGAWALMILGFGGAGAALRARRLKAGFSAA